MKPSKPKSGSPKNQRAAKTTATTESMGSVGQGFSPDIDSSTKTGALRAAERGHFNTRNRAEHPSGAKAHADDAAVSARLKSCPVTEPAPFAVEASLSEARSVAEGRSSSKPVPNSKAKTAAKSPTTEPQLVEIAKPVYGGQFLAHIEGKAVFVPLTLPGEQVRIRVTQSKSGYSTAELTEILTPSPLRTPAPCPYFGACGGCNYQHTGYENQLALKQEVLRETLERGGVAPPEEIIVLRANPWAYRNRVRLAIDANGNIGYRSRRSHAVIPIAQCPIAAPLLLTAAHAAADYLQRVPANLRPTELAFFCDPAESALLATFFASDSAGVRLEPLAQAIRERIPALRSAELAADGRPGHPPRTLAQWGEASLTYPAAGFDYRVDHGAFFQVNRWLIDDLVESVTAHQTGRLAWDLFAGVGLFARKLTASFDRVVAVESAPASKAALQHNLQGTGGQPVHADTLQFLRDQNALSQSNKSIPDLIVLDPPRSGLGAEVTALLASIAAPAMVYVSCDPATLARDLRALVASGYQIQSVTLADLFPQTFHLETVVHLRRA